MGNIRIPEKVKLITGLISNDTALFDRAKKMLERKFKNRVDFESGVLSFTHTDYYNKEMGGNLKRKFLSFEKPVPLRNIEKVKIVANSVEKKFSVGTRRAINIDPGYLDLSKIVLFSTKDYSHRIHIGGGIFAEATLCFRDGRFNPWPWTYPDYKTEAYIAIFNSIRENYKNNRKG